MPGVDNLGMGKPSDLVQGTLDLLILKTLALEALHGWAIAKRIQQVSGEVLQVQQGSLYPALHRLEQQGWIRAKWQESETGRRLFAPGAPSARETLGNCGRSMRPKPETQKLTSSTFCWPQ